MSSIITESSIVTKIRLEVPRLRVEPTPREEHVLVCISPSPNNARVIEAGAVLARAFGAKFTALYVEPPTGRRNSGEIAHQLEANLNLAAKAGAEQAISYGADIPLQIAEFAKTRARDQDCARSCLRKSLVVLPQA